MHLCMTALLKGLLFMNTPSAVSILIADDEASIRNGLRSAVESLDPNLQVLGTARNGLEQ